LWIQSGATTLRLLLRIRHKGGAFYLIGFVICSFEGKYICEFTAIIKP
jgi:hypothetical protein